MKHLFPIVCILCCNIADCEITNLFHMLDKHIPNVFVRWSGTVVKRSWEHVLKTELVNAHQLTGLDKKFGKKYSYKKYQDCEFGIDPSTNFQHSCVCILTDLNIYKNIGTIKGFFTKEQLLKYKKHLNNLIQGNVLLEVIQIGYNSSIPEYSISRHIQIDLKNVSVNIIFKSVDVYFSIIVDNSLSEDSNKPVIKSIKLERHLPLKRSSENNQQILRLQIDEVDNSRQNKIFEN